MIEIAFGYRRYQHIRLTIKRHARCLHEKPRLHRSSHPLRSARRFIELWPSTALNRGTHCITRVECRKTQAHGVVPCRLSHRLKTNTVPIQRRAHACVWNEIRMCNARKRASRSVVIPPWWRGQCKYLRKPVIFELFYDRERRWIYSRAEPVRKKRNRRRRQWPSRYVVFE